LAYVRDRFVPYLKAWAAGRPGLVVASILGNHDWLSTRDELRAMRDRGEIVLLDQSQAWRFRDVSFLGFSHTPPTPFYLKDFERRDLPNDPVPDGTSRVWDANAKRAREVDPAEHYAGQPALADLLAAAPPVQSPWIFVCHAPPYDTTLDRLPGIEFPVGSKAVRSFIEARHPLCALHGHIHESPMMTGSFRDRVGSTLCVNPGQTDDHLHAVVLDSDDPSGTLRHTVYA
jgi:Icc-related predicted phosphoesterase